MTDTLITLTPDDELAPGIEADATLYALVSGGHAPKPPLYYDQDNPDAYFDARGFHYVRSEGRYVRSSEPRAEVFA